MAQAGGEHFLSLFDPDPYAAEKKYQTLRSKLVFFFRHNRCPDPENMADEVFVRTLRRIDEGVKPESGIAAYCYGVANLLILEERRGVHPQSLPEDLPQKHHPAPADLNHPERSVFLDELLGGLSEDEKRLFARYYLDDRAELAKSERMTPNSLRIRVFRIRQKMQEQKRPGSQQPAAKSETV